MLPDLLVNATTSPFHNVVARCDATAFDSKLLQLIIQYKWETNARTYRMRSIGTYGCACVIDAVAMWVSVTSDDAGTIAFNAADVLQGLVVVIELASLGLGAFHIVSFADIQPLISSCTYLLPPVDCVRWCARVIARCPVAA